MRDIYKSDNGRLYPREVSIREILGERVQSRHWWAGTAKTTIREHRMAALAAPGGILLKLPVAMFEELARIYRHLRRIDSFFAEEGPCACASAAPALSSMLI